LSIEAKIHFYHGTVNDIDVWEWVLFVCKGFDLFEIQQMIVQTNFNAEILI